LTEASQVADQLKCSTYTSKTGNEEEKAIVSNKWLGDVRWE